MLPYHQCLEHCHRPDMDFEALCRKLEAYRDNLRTSIEAGALPALGCVYDTDDLEPLRLKARALAQRFRHIIILGTGGSSLGGSALYELSHSRYRKKGTTPRLHIITNIDPFTFEDMIARQTLQNTGVIAISKSGATLETLMQLLRLIDVFRAHVGADQLREHFTIITQPHSPGIHNPIRALAQRFDLPTLDHDPRIGGRYSVLSLVGLFPALLAGLDANTVREGARCVLEQSLNTSGADNPPLAGAAVAVGLRNQHHITSQVMLSYSDRLGSLARWARQLWAESLGKNGQGTTPIYGTGPVDQHSQLQLWLDGPKDKMFTILGASNATPSPTLSDDLTATVDMPELAGTDLHQLMIASRRATTESLIQQNLPVRQIILTDINAHALGALFMHFMLETIYAAHLMEVNPFDQPAVEFGKKLSYAYLTESATDSS